MNDLGSGYWIKEDKVYKVSGDTHNEYVSRWPSKFGLKRIDTYETNLTERVLTRGWARVRLNQRLQIMCGTRRQAQDVIYWHKLTFGEFPEKVAVQYAVTYRDLDTLAEVMDFLEE